MDSESLKAGARSRFSGLGFSEGLSAHSALGPELLGKCLSTGLTHRQSKARRIFFVLAV